MLVNLAQNFIALAQHSFEAFLEIGKIPKVTDAYTHAGHLVSIAGTNPSLGGSNHAAFFLVIFTEAVEKLVVRQNQMSLFRNKKTPLHINAFFLQDIHFFKKRLRINDNTVANHTDLVFVENARRNQMQDMRLIVKLHGMSGIVTALVADDNIALARQNIDNLSFSFIAPLGADQNPVHASFFLLNKF